MRAAVSLLETAMGVTRSREVAMGGYGLQVGRADIRSAGPITFGPDGILFLADNAEIGRASCRERV